MFYITYRASMAGSDTVVRELLQCGGRDVAAKNEDGHSALHLAAFYGNLEVIELLIQFGANINEANSSGYTPLHVSCQSNKVQIIQILLKAGANPTIRNQLTTWVPLHEAAWNGFVECKI